MLETQGVALKFYAHFVESKVGKTGLTVTVDVYRNGVEIVTAAAATEVGDGLYSYTLAAGSNNAEGEYIAIFKTATTTVDQREIPALWVVDKGQVELIDDIKSQTDRIGSAAATILSPVLVNRDVEITAGDDYDADESRALEWSTQNETDWPTLTGATIQMAIRPVAGTITDTDDFGTGSVVTGTGANKKVRVELTSAETTSLSTGKRAYEYDLQATLSNARKVTLARGYVTVHASIQD